jgi:hypothetical protein
MASHAFTKIVRPGDVQVVGERGVWMSLRSQVAGMRMPMPQLGRIVVRRKRHGRGGPNYLDS